MPRVTDNNTLLRQEHIHKAVVVTYTHITEEDISIEHSHLALGERACDGVLNKVLPVGGGRDQPVMTSPIPALNVKGC